MSVTVVATTNETSFAVAYADATALVLDALAAGRGFRKTTLDRAEDRLTAALSYTDDTNGPEGMLVRQLQETIKLYRRKGWDRL